MLPRRRLLRGRRLRVHASPPQAPATAQRASKNSRPGRARPAAASPAARAARGASKRRGRGGGAGEQEDEVARHGVRVRARAGGHGHGRDQEAPARAAARRRERALLRRRRGVGALEADPVAELQGRRGRGGRRGAGEAGVGERAEGGSPLLLIEAGAAREGPKATPAGEAVSAHGGVVTGVAPIGWWKLRGTGAKRCLLMFSFNLFSSSPSAVLNKTFFWL